MIHLEHVRAVLCEKLPHHTQFFHGFPLVPLHEVPPLEKSSIQFFSNSLRWGIVDVHGHEVSGWELCALATSNPFGVLTVLDVSNDAHVRLVSTRLTRLAILRECDPPEYNGLPAPEQLIIRKPEDHLPF